MEEASLSNFSFVSNTSEDDVSMPAPAPTPDPICYFCDMPFNTGELILWAFNVIVLPAFGILGVFGNISSMVVLKLQGLNKSSNIMLIALAFGDLMYLLGCNNIYTVWRGYYKHPVSYQAAQNWYALWATQNFLMETGNVMSILLVAMVTVERLVAVYLPLKFTSIIRPQRTRVAVFVVFVFAVVKASIGLVRLSWKYNYNKNLPVMKRSLFYFEHQEFFDGISTAYKYVNGFIPLMLILVGSILIGLKVSWAAAARAKMLSSNGGEKGGDLKAPARSSRTTKTLLCVCVLFSCTVGVGFGIETFLPFSYTFRFTILYDKFNFTLYAINSSCNFIIYVLMNKNFRETYVSVLMPWRAKQSSGPDKPGLSRTSTNRTMS